MDTDTDAMQCDAIRVDKMNLLRAYGRRQAQRLVFLETVPIKEGYLQIRILFCLFVQHNRRDDL